MVIEYPLYVYIQHMTSTFVTNIHHFLHAELQFSSLSIGGSRSEFAVFLNWLFKKNTFEMQKSRYVFFLWRQATQTLYSVQKKNKQRRIKKKTQLPLADSMFSIILWMLCTRSAICANRDCSTFLLISLCTDDCMATR